MRSINASIFSIDTFCINCPKLVNERGATCVANRIVQYETNGNVPAEFKIRALGNDGVKIDSIGHYTLSKLPGLAEVDLEGIE